MRTVRETVLIEAQPEAVWEVLVEPHYIPKLYPDILNITVVPPGRATIGQERTAGGRAGKRIIEFRTKVTGLVPNKRFEVVGRNGGAFEEFSEVIELSPVNGGTRLEATFKFKVALEYFGPGFDPLALEEMAVRNQRVYVKNVKDLSELKRVV